MNKFRVMIIDDERLAREEIKRHLQSYPDFALIGEAENADDAEELINTMHPELLFLDIQMPERSGFDLLESLEYVPEIIFTTAFDHYAVRAFEQNALDYLVKPIREERFAKAIEKVRIKLAINEKEESVLSAERTIFVKEGEEYHFVRIKDIYLIESMGNYARLYFDRKKVYIKRSLNQLEKTLDPTLFFRISRTEIINTAYIKQIHSLPKGRLSISLQTGEKLMVSSRQSAEFKNRHIII
ncbi:LytR/AlgR family response regulator transcription factor [Runella sp.]|uniref:LytR/AlgR family response regulator transcription factor n=1 Tax=Runella sp. TaxID=1960881 RepID=UPI003D0E409F